MISDGACRHAASARSSGFVLVGVVWFLAIMTLLASAAVLWVGRSLDATENRRKALLRELEEHALLARVQWLVATQRYTVAGLSVPGNAGAAPSKVDMDTSILPIGGELPLDGREVCMANGWCIALLDRSARLSLSGIDPRVLSRLLAGLGVPAEQVQVMVAQWFSYLYPGAAPRLGSAAQASDRSSSGQARRRPLRSVMEVFRLEAWRPWEAHLLDAGWCDLVAADEAALNINTADARILSLAWGLPEDAVGRLLQARWQRPFTRMSDLHDILGGHARLVPEDGWARLASPVLSIRLYPPGAEQGTEYEVRFNSEHRLLPPWQLLSKRSVKINDRYSNPPLHPDIAPGFLPPRLWQGRGKGWPGAA